MGNTFTTCLQVRFAIAFVALLSVFSAFSQASGTSVANTPIEQAIELLKANEPAKAKAILLDEIAVAPSAIAYGNLATAELALRNQAEAAYAFEMSRALGGFSGSEAFRQNLQQTLPAELRSLSDSPFRKVIQPVLRAFPENSFAGIAIFSGLLAFIVGLGLLFKAKFTTNAWSHIALLGLIISCALALVLAEAQSSYRNSSSAVVMVSTQLYSAPSTQSRRIRNMPAGAVVTVGELLNGTYQVTLPTGIDGWIAEADLSVVKEVNLPE